MHLLQYGGNVDCRIFSNRARAGIDRILRNIKNSHNDCHCVGDDKYRNPGFEKILEKAERIKIVHIVSVGYHRHQFVHQHKRDYHARNGNNHRIGYVLYHGEYFTVPAYRGLSNIPGNGGDLLVYVIEHIR